ncbi:DDE-type integrase/transposase/recombinase [Thermoanaerobacter sp. RKWS2]|uniref:DDE-type integrase/transposase/recombinase n=1 Tax=Thermoanaerobacter sp. RKWS2 TaxID=2983842 RepID=UPI00224A696E|nr:DDE-type integrase/transposase/recombinase [Thermoanaerobacter sp. RKWS2]UZQ81802.1 DDE-type integrase/transposase/recombinase [Thermoanaerobacter sp. RKWS2]UZQ82894.1 DDE-type integrase/transposase/recombinase [Thermoanaerobacter sp. RKWS2]UZQ82984.1 DDE-type integrase/transposase/recombinase [Thermoanaerobacter sp. RKWS2]UZQ83740.1 DDE-type integrase/transposase/recombinase [Thermoanaerobacter sp. RKWS2]
MLDEKAREAIALKRFSLISPVLNGQVKNQKEYFDALSDKPIEIPYLGMRRYTPKTLRGWLYQYLRGGIEALKPGYRSDRGKYRKIDFELSERIKQKKLEHPEMPNKLLYETLIGEGIISPDKVSLSTFYRFLKNIPVKSLDKEKEGKTKRFSHEYINELWQTDVMYGPYIKEGKTKRQTYLIAYIDDASRLCTYAHFYYTQNFLALRDSFKEAVLRRGIPKMLYTDNGKIYRSSQFEYICASLGTSLIHAEPFSPHSKGKIERFFHTVRMRFLSTIDPTSIKSIDELNMMFFKWLEDDYNRKEHSSIGMSPLDFFMSQISRVNMCKDIDMLNECFLIRVNRKVNKDATLKVENILYETEEKFKGMRLEVRYDPQWLKDNTPLLLFHEGKKVGEAYKVNFHDNAKIPIGYTQNKNAVSRNEELVDFIKHTVISFNDIID